MSPSPALESRDHNNDKATHDPRSRKGEYTTHTSKSSSCNVHGRQHDLHEEEEEGKASREEGDGPGERKLTLHLTRPRPAGNSGCDGKRARGAGAGARRRSGEGERTSRVLRRVQQRRQAQAQDIHYRLENIVLLVTYIEPYIFYPRDD